MEKAGLFFISGVKQPEIYLLMRDIMNRFDDRYALVTGAGSGIGAAIARGFGSEGAFVYVVDIDPEKAQDVAGQIINSGGQALDIVADVTDGPSVKDAIQKVQDHSGKLDIIVNNAGMNVRTDLRHMTDEEWDLVLQVNLVGGARFARDGLELLRASDNAAIVNLASVMGTRSTRQMSAYSATKAAMASLSRGLAVEYAPFNIRVNYLCPGFVATNLTSRFVRNPFVKDQILARTPMGRFGEPEEIAKAALFLASDDASYMTGSGITVDGGMMAAL